MPNSSKLNRRDFLTVFYKTIDDLDELRVSPDLQMKLEPKRRVLYVICTLQMLHDLLKLNDIEGVEGVETTDTDDTTDDTVETDSLDSNVFVQDCGCCKH